MNKFDKEMEPIYERFDKAFESNDIKELAFFSQFCIEKDLRKWQEFYRRQICENVRTNTFWLKCGLKGVELDDCGWHEWKIPGYEKQEFYPLGEQINRGSCNITEEMALGVMHLPNGKWIAKIDWDFTKIGHSFLYLGIYDEQCDSRTEAVNNAIKRYVDSWYAHNKCVKKEDAAVVKAKSMIIVDTISPAPAIKGTPIQLSLF